MLIAYTIAAIDLDFDAQLYFSSILVRQDIIFEF